MNEINAYKIEKEAREKRLLSYSEEIEKRMRKTSSEIIKELVEERHRQNLTQQEVADMTGILSSNLARFIYLLGVRYHKSFIKTRKRC